MEARSSRSIIGQFEALFSPHTRTGHKGGITGYHLREKILNGDLSKETDRCGASARNDQQTIGPGGVLPRCIYERRSGMVTLKKYEPGAVCNRTKRVTLIR